MLSFIMAKSNPQKLMQMYLDTKDVSVKAKVIDQLISLKANDSLKEILLKEKNIKISEYFFDLATEESDFLVNNFTSFVESVQKKIIDLLISKKLDDFLLKLVNTKFKQSIYEYLITENSDSETHLVEKFKFFDAEGKDFAIKSILSSRNAKAIRFMLNSEYKETLLSFFTREYHKLSFEEILWINDIDAKLLENTNEIREDILDSKEFDLISHYVIQTNNYNLRDFILFWSKFAEIISLNAFVSHHIFYMFSEKQRLFLMLWIYGISDYIDVPECAFRFYSVENYYAAVKDAVSLKINDFNKFFNSIFNEAFDEFKFKKAILAFLIDNKKFEDMLEDASIFLDDIVSESEDIEGFSDFTIRSYGVENEVEQALQKQISKLAFVKKYNNLKFLKKYAFDIDNNLVCNDYFTINNYIKANKVDITSFSAETAVVKDIEKEKIKLDDHLSRLLYILTNENSISKVRKMVEVRKSSLIKYEDFIYSLSLLTEHEKNNPKMTEILGNILVKTEENEVKLAILYYMFESSDPAWGQYLANTKISFKDDLIAFYYYRFITNKGIIPKQEYLIEFLQKKSFWKEDYKFANYKSISKCQISDDGINVGYISDNNDLSYFSIIDLDKNQSVQVINDIVDFKFLDDNKLFICRSRNNNLAIKDMFTRLSSSEYKPTTDNSKIVLSSKKDYSVLYIDKELKLYSLNEKKVVFKSSFKYFINEALFSHKNRMLLSFSAYELSILYLNQMEEKRLTFELQIKNVTVSNDERYVIVVLGDRWNNEFNMYDIETGFRIYSFNSENTITDTCFSYHCNYFAVSSADKQKESQIVIYDFNQINQIALIKKGKEISVIKFFKDYPFIAFACENEVTVFDYHKKLYVKIFTMTEKVIDLVISPQSNRLLIITNSSIASYHYIDVSKFACLNLLQTALSFFYTDKKSELEHLFSGLPNVKIEL